MVLRRRDCWAWKPLVRTTRVSPSYQPLEWPSQTGMAPVATIPGWRAEGTMRVSWFPSSRNTT
jgi:hypothetical protein